MSNNIDALRAHLFETLTALKDKDNPMDIERAKAVSDVAQVIINTAKVEVEFARVTGKDTGGAFLGRSHAPENTEQGKPPFPATPAQTTFESSTETKGLPAGITARHVHRVRG